MSTIHFLKFGHKKTVVVQICMDQKQIINSLNPDPDTAKFLDPDPDILIQIRNAG